MSNLIRIRACLAVVQQGQILLIPHYNTDVGPVQWCIPGGAVEFGEELEVCARREFGEETGLQAQITGLLDVSEVVLPARPAHSITVTFSGIITGGNLQAEMHPVYGEKKARWFSWHMLRNEYYHPAKTVAKGLGIELP